MAGSSCATSKVLKDFAEMGARHGLKPWEIPGKVLLEFESFSKLLGRKLGQNLLQLREFQGAIRIYIICTYMHTASHVFAFFLLICRCMVFDHTSQVRHVNGLGEAESLCIDPALCSRTGWRDIGYRCCSRQTWCRGNIWDYLVLQSGILVLLCNHGSVFSACLSFSRSWFHSQQTALFQQKAPPHITTCNVISKPSNHFAQFHKT
jgi:hypothetical protein